MQGGERREGKKPAEKPDKVTASVGNIRFASVERCIRGLGFAIVSGGSPLLFWCDNYVDVNFCLRLKPWQFVNHFPGTFSIARKVEFARNYQQMQKRFPAEYDFHPLTYFMPSQTCDVKRALGTLGTVIVKPDLGAMGRGVFLAQTPDAIGACSESAVAQAYLEPFLIDGLKFDLRLYVLIASVDLLRLHSFREGMARFCTERYAPPIRENLDEACRHLTSCAVNRRGGLHGVRR